MKIINLLFVVLCLVPPAFAQKKRVDNELKAIMEKYEAIGLSVAVLKEHKIVYKSSFGLKDVEKGKSLKNKDIFRIASISKSFTATSLMQLVEQGSLSLNDDVSDLIGFRIRNPKFPDKVITLEMILSHRSSLNDKNGYFTLDVLDTTKTPTWRNSFNEYEPGNGYMYCNLNFNLAGTILEKVSGQRFDRYIKEHILDPLGLYGGYWVDGLDSSRFVKLYEYVEDEQRFKLSTDAYAPRRKELSEYRIGYSAPVLSPTGGMKISAVDLAKYMDMHMYYGQFKKGHIISETSSRRMQTALTEKSGYGLALWHDKELLPGVELVGHTGSAYGLYSAMFFHPEDKYGFVVITNGLNTNKGVDDFRRDCIKVLYEDLLN
ncbi:serine hydrolase domain-containing protein [Olivibacter sitiensis]|uniref:serine hydrolase domain-containing protein n=1 Tax=Olivibacter sitiensis TaxID=376470 RepID=UPI00048A36EC|nr:serine hydrolase domain-containing protein [Olivibacter sitiensis]